MKLSIIVPVYNCGKYLNNCIDSILNQNLSDFELILVNDGSSDSSGEICEQYASKDTRIIVIHKENSGQADARNCGLDIAHGEYIGFVDADDYIDPQMYEYLISLSEKYDADVVTCEFECVNEHGDVIKQVESANNNVLVSSKELLSNFYYTGSSPCYTTGVVWNKIYRKSIFEGLRFPSGKIYEDTYIIPYIFEKARNMYICSKPFYKYFIRPNSTITSNYSKKRLDIIDAGINHYHFFMERPQYNQLNYAQDTYVQYYMRNYYAISLCFPQYKKEFAPYKENFMHMLWSILRNPIICKVKKLNIILAVLFPRVGILISKKLFPELIFEEFL